MYPYHNPENTFAWPDENQTVHPNPAGAGYPSPAGAGYPDPGGAVPGIPSLLDPYNGLQQPQQVHYQPTVPYMGNYMSHGYFPQPYQDQSYGAPVPNVGDYGAPYGGPSVQQPPVNDPFNQLNNQFGSMSIQQPPNTGITSIYALY